ncbi:hypothetical protein COOONC_22313 [Cooperia oncophora]
MISSLNIFQQSDDEEHSPGLSQKIKIPKKRYSYADPLERMDTPMFDKNRVNHAKKGPSSAATVLTMAGVFVVGILLMMSGTIVLIAVSFDLFRFPLNSYKYYLAQSRTAPNIHFS